MAKKVNFRHSDESLKKTFLNIHAYDLARIFERENDEHQEKIIMLCPIERLADIFVELEEDDQQMLFSMLDESRQKKMLRMLESDDLKAFIEIFEGEQQNNLLDLLPKYKAKTIRLLLTYEEDQAAYIMTTDFMALNINLSIKEATNTIISHAKETDYIDTIFIVDDNGLLQGTIDIKDLIIARPSASIHQIMDEHSAYVYADDTIEQAIQQVRDYDEHALPVLERDGRLLGIITADDIFDEIIEDYEDDYERMAQITDYESATSAFQRSRKRLPWLLIGVLLNLLTITILLNFGATLEQVTALILFQPMILGQAGNIGTQALAVTILGIHRHDLDQHKDAMKHFVKEFSIGLINSLMIAGIAFIYVSIYLNLLHIGSENPLKVALAVFAALLTVMTISSMMGTLVPMTLSKMKVDPAAASGPFMSTINDIISLVVYFSIATLLFVS